MNKEWDRPPTEALLKPYTKSAVHISQWLTSSKFIEGLEAACKSVLSAEYVYFEK